MRVFTDVSGRSFYLNSKEVGIMIKYVPNILTIVRIIFAFFVFFLLLAMCYYKQLGIQENSLASIHLLIIFLVSTASISDAVDGNIARKYNCISKFGQIWDPRADKALTFAYFPLILLGMVNFIPVALLFVRDSHVTWLRSQINRPFPARLSGKWKTIISFPLMCVLIAIIPVEGNIFLWLFRFIGLDFIAKFFLNFQKEISLFGGALLGGFCVWSWVDYYLALKKAIREETGKVKTKKLIPEGLRFRSKVQSSQTF